MWSDAILVTYSKERNEKIHELHVGNLVNEVIQTDIERLLDSYGDILR